VYIPSAIYVYQPKKSKRHRENRDTLGFRGQKRDSECNVCMYAGTGKIHVYICVCVYILYVTLFYGSDWRAQT